MPENQRIIDIGLDAVKGEVRRRFLVAVKASYWNQFRDGLVGRNAVRELVAVANDAISREYDICLEWKRLHSLLESTSTSRCAYRLLTSPILGTFALKYFHKLRYGYDVVSAFVVAREEALSHVNHALRHSHDVDQRVSLTLFVFLDIYVTIACLTHAHAHAYEHADEDQLYSSEKVDNGRC